MAFSVKGTFKSLRNKILLIPLRHAGYMLFKSSVN